MIRKRFSAALALIRWDKPYGTLLLLTPALWSLVLASNGTPPVYLIGIFVIGAFLMRSAGCAINDLADHPFDGFVDRTKNRPLVSGRLTPFEAFAIFSGLSVAAFILLWWLNPLTRLLSVIAMGLAVVYPFTKRFFRAPQLVMGVAFGWGTVMAWAAVRNTLEWTTAFVFLATVFWAAAYDTIYAMMDRSEDRRAGLHSTAILFEKNIGAAVGLLFGIAVVFLLLAGLTAGLGATYYFSVGVAASWFLYQTLALRFRQDRAGLFSLFKSHAVIGFIILAGLLIGYHVP